MTPCERARGHLIDRILAQLDDAAQQEVDRHLLHCAACRAEHQSYQLTIQGLRRVPALRASPRFRAQLSRRLAAAMLEEAEAGRGSTAARASSVLRFRAGLLAYRLQTSARLKLQLAAAALLILLSIAVALWGSARRTAEHTTVADSFHPVEGTAGSGPAGESDGTLRLVQRQVERFSDRELLPLVPPEAPAEDETLLPEPAPGRPERAVRALPPIDQQPGTPPLRARDQPAVPGAFPEPIQGVEGAIHRGLRWLARQQRDDGSFGARSGSPQTTVAATAATLLAFLSEGALGLEQSPRDQVTRKALLYLLDQAQPDGRIGPPVSAAYATFNHAVACLALLEHLLYTRDRAGPPEWSRERQVVVDGLEYLERRLADLFHDTRPELRYGEGENAAWASLALLTAMRSGLDLGLLPDTEARLSLVMRRLRNERTPSGAVTGHAVMAMIIQSTPLSALDAAQWEQDWHRVINPVIAQPEAATPALRFLVASALCPWEPKPESARLWSRYQPDLEAAVLALQDPEHGHFWREDPEHGLHPRAVGAFDGGEIFDTALCVLTLQVASRSENLRRAARGR